MSGAIAHVAATLMPIFLVILLGYALRMRLITGAAFWDGAEKLTYYLFLPVLLVSGIAKTDLQTVPLSDMALGLAGGTLLTALFARLARPLLGADGAAYSSLFQGSIRCGAYVSIATAFVLLGDEGIALIAVAIVVIVPLSNLLSVSVILSNTGEKAGWRRLLVSIVTNPMILACLLGVILNLSGIGLPRLIEPLLGILSQAALPVGLLAVGAGLRFTALAAAKLVATASALKLVAMPFFVFILLDGLGVGNPHLLIAVLFAGSSVAPSSYVLARQLGGDATLMAGIVTATTLAAMATLPILILLVGQ
jgi:predicted permease